MHDGFFAFFREMDGPRVSTARYTSFIPMNLPTHSLLNESEGPCFNGPDRDQLEDLISVHDWYGERNIHESFMHVQVQY